MLNFESLSRLRDQCLNHYPEGEMWPNYYERRLQEFANFTDLLPQKRLGKVLELGCGNGYYSAFLSQIADKVIASDTETPPIFIHTGGLDRARLLMERLNITNVDVTAASVENLPFEDASFDMVFSSHVLGYIPDVKQAISEIERVLKPGGLHFCVVPTRAAAIYRLIDYQFYLMKRVWVKIFSKREKTSSLKGPSPQRKVSRHFPFPTPQSGFRSWFHEFRSTSPKKWESTVTLGGAIPVIHRASTQLNPFLAMENLIPSRWAIRLHSKIRKTEALMGRYRFAQNFGNNLVLITQKKSPSEEGQL